LARSEHGDASPAEVSLLRKTGERFPALIRPKPISDEHGQTLAWLNTITDLSTARHAEAALKASEQRWRSIAENPFDFVIIIGRDYKYRFINHVLPGLRVEEVIGVWDRSISWRGRIIHAFDTSSTKPFAPAVHPPTKSTCWSCP
jgi:PAS domain-containing protein